MRIIFINGWSASSSLLGAFKEQLSKKYEVIVLDHLYQYSAEEIYTQLNRLMVKDTVLMGWSLGGMLAVRYLLESEDAQSTLKALVLLQTPPCFLQKKDWQAGVSREDFDSLQKLVVGREALKFVRHFTQLMISGSADISAERRAVKAHFKMSDSEDWPLLIKGLNTLKELDLRDSLSLLTLPVLGIYGENDVLIKQEAMTTFGEFCPQFKGVLMSDMGHFPFGMLAEKVATCVDDFLQTLALTSPNNDSY